MKPVLKSEVFINRLNSEYYYGFTPFDPQGVCVFNQGAKKVLDLIDGQKTSREILRILSQDEPGLDLAHIKKILKRFTEAGLFKGKNSGKDFPSPELGVWLHITNQCNLRCTYCYIPKSARKMSYQTGKAVVDKIIFSAKKHGFKRIKFKFAGGEPLLELETVLQIKRYAQKKLASELDPKFVILTNGVLLRNKVCQRLKKENFYVAVSLDGLGEYHNKTRKFANGQGSFRQTNKGIQNLKNHQIPFNITTTIAAQNVDNLPALTDWCLKNEINFAFNFFRENPYTKQKIKPESNNRLIDNLTLTYQEIEKNLPRYPVWNAVLDRVNFNFPHLQCCGVGRSYLVVDTDGAISNCQVEIEKKIGKIQKVGDPLSLAREKWFAKGITVDDKDGCKTCRWRYLCAGGCPLLTDYVFGNLKNPSPYCPVYKALIPKVIRLEALRVLDVG